MEEEITTQSEHSMNTSAHSAWQSESHEFFRARGGTIAASARRAITSGVAHHSASAADTAKVTPLLAQGLADVPGKEAMLMVVE